MAKKNIRRRPATPNLKVAQVVQPQDQQLTAADPNSPPETPTTSPPFSRKISLKPRRQPDFHDYFQSLGSDPNIRPVGNGHQFSYQPSVGPEQLSPRSSSSSDMPDDSSEDDSSEEDDEDEDDDISESPSIRSLANGPGPAASSEADESDMDLSDSESSSDSDDSESDSGSESDRSGETDDAETSHLTAATTATAACGFTLEDVDPMDSDCEGLDVLQPTEIESNRSRSRSRHRKAHKTMVKDFRNLNCSNETSDNEQADREYDPAEEEFLRRREQLRKFRRMSMGSSFGKRTHSELSDSEDDDETLDVNEVGSSARRMRRKLQRTSLLFHDPPPARIEELEEPNSSEDEYVATQSLARELPYWAMEIMEMDSSSSSS